MKAKRNYKCGCCQELIAKRSDEIDFQEVWYANEGGRTYVFCSTDCAARWRCDEADLDEVQRDWWG